METLNRIGLEFNAVGNHEFDKGSAELLRLQKGGCKITDGATDPNSCRGDDVGTPVPFEGAKFRWLSANVLRDGGPDGAGPPPHAAAALRHQVVARASARSRSLSSA